MVRQETLDKMSPADRQILLEESRKISQNNASLIMSAMNANIETMKAAGMEFYTTFPAAERNEWANMPGVKAITEDWISQMEGKGLPGRKVVDAFLAAKK